MLEQSDIDQIKQLIVDAITTTIVRPTTPPPKKKRKYTKRVKTPKVAKELTKIVQELKQVSTPITGIRVRKMGQVQTKNESVRGPHGKQCRTEPMQIISNRPNNFLGSADAKMFKSDVEIDKKLSGNNTPSPRRQETEMWEVVCKVCGGTSIVSPSTVMLDEDTHEVSYTCDSCIRR
jgi:hypothetical protein